MNFLAHFYLAGRNSDLLIGNFIADAVKGSRYNDYPEGIRMGILMHRHIDHYTDTQAVVRESKHRLWTEFQHFAPVIVDVFYDHFLAANWEKYSPQILGEFAFNVYSVLEEAEAHLPDKPRLMLPFMKKHDWLSSYAHVEGIRQVLTGMARRTSHVSGMEKASIALEQHYELYQKEFELFFPELIASSNDFINNYKGI